MMLSAAGIFLGQFGGKTKSSGIYYALLLSDGKSPLQIFRYFSICYVVVSPCRGNNNIEYRCNFRNEIISFNGSIFITKAWLSDVIVNFFDYTYVSAVNYTRKCEKNIHNKGKKLFHNNR